MLGLLLQRRQSIAFARLAKLLRLVEAGRATTAAMISSLKEKSF